MADFLAVNKFNDEIKFFHRAILNNIPDMAWLKDGQGRYISANDAFSRACGINSVELVGKNDAGLWPEDLAKKYRADDVEVMQLGAQKVFEEQLVNKDGSTLWVETVKTPIYNDKGQVIGTTGIARDITARKGFESNLQETRDALEAVVQQRAAELLKANEELRSEIIARKQVEEKLGVLNAELLKSNKRLKQLSLTDPHTGLFNHRFLEEVIESEFHRAKRYGHELSVIMLDIDYFKSINDVYGYQFGDLVLKQFARQLKSFLRRYDIAVRFGGDEFIVISPGIGRTQALMLAQRLLDALNLFNFGDKAHSVKLKISLAIAAYPEDGISRGMGLINLVSQIIDKAKESGGNRVNSILDIKKVRRTLAEKNKKEDGVKILKSKLEKITAKANQNLIESIFAFAKTIELKDHYTGEHVENTVRYATGISRALSLPKEEIELVRQAAMLHDLGKIGVSEKILHKKAKLTKKEFAAIKKHPQIGADIIRPIQFLHSLIPYIFYHHERWDGKGYPSGIRGEEIPMGSRIIAIADVYQALISDRPYRKAYSKKDALKIIKSGSGTQFDPLIADTFLKILSKERK
ncbi:MAG: diguanylate cyclase [Candidatus Omnitrophota bacterium]